MNKNNDSKEQLGTPALLTELMILMSKCASVYGQKRVFNRALALVMAELFAFRRHTITQLLLTLGITEEDWSAWYRLFSHKRFDEKQTSAVMLGEMLAEVPESDPFVVGGRWLSRAPVQSKDTGYWVDERAQYGQIQTGYPTGAALCGRVVVDANRQWLQSRYPHPLLERFHRQICAEHKRRTAYRSASVLKLFALDTKAIGCGWARRANGADVE